MTQNQINFAKLQEDKRHNLEMERQGVQSIGENVRHNYALEGVNWYTAQSDRALKDAQINYQNVQAEWYPKSVVLRNRDTAIGYGIYDILTNVIPKAAEERNVDQYYNGSYDSVK
jgi:hypothetical protein